MTPTSSRSGAVLFLACAAQFMVVVDIAIVNVALPSIQRDLHLAPSTLQWIVIAYGLFLGGFLLLGGRLGDLLGRRRIFLTGLVLFTAASLVAGIATTGAVLVVARGVQGFAAALIAPSALAILAATFAEGEARNRALGVFGAIGGASASVGVTASGALTDGVGWRWIFFINVPVGVALTLVAATVLRDDRPPRAARRFDLGGAVTVTSALLFLVYALQKGSEYGWQSARTLAMFAGAAALLAAFVVIERRTPAPLVAASTLRRRTLVAANLTAALVFGAFFSFIFLGSLFMQQGLGYSPTRTGVAWLATSVTGFIAAGITGAKLVPRFGPRPLLVIGLVLFAIGGLWLARVPARADYVTDLLPPFILAGLAVGFGAVSVQIAALTGIEPSEFGLASGLVETMREVGGAIGVAAVATVLFSSAPGAMLAGFHDGFRIIAGLAAAGALVAALTFPGRTPDRGVAT